MSACVILCKLEYSGIPGALDLRALNFLTIPLRFLPEAGVVAGADAGLLRSSSSRKTMPNGVGSARGEPLIVVIQLESRS